MTEMQPMRPQVGGEGSGLEWSSSPPSNGAIASLHGEGGGAFDGPIGGGAGSPGHGQAGSAGTTGAAPNGVQSFFSSPFASVGVEYGKTLLRDNSLLSGGLGGWLRGSRLRYYFQVSQASTRRKMAKLLLPYIHYDWKRQPLDESDAGLLEAGSAAAAGAAPSASFAPPSADLNAPDLYLGSMAFVTFVVTMGFALGSVNEFDPELIGLTATRSLVSLLLEVGCIQAMFYLSAAPQTPALLDLLSLCSYKYVALNIDILVGVIFGSTVFWIVFLALAASTAVFMLRTLNGWVPSSSAALGSNPGSPRFRTMIAASAALQLLFSLFLLYPALPAVQASRGLSGLMSVARAETQPGGMLGPSAGAGAAAVHEARLPVPAYTPDVKPVATPTPTKATPQTASPQPATVDVPAPAAAPAVPSPSPAPGDIEPASFEPTPTDAEAKQSAGPSSSRPANRRPTGGARDNKAGAKSFKPNLPTSTPQS